MSRFTWPAPEIDFIGAIEDVGDHAESQFFVCCERKILRTFDDARRWRPLAESEIGPFTITQRHFMGKLGDTACFALEVADENGQSFIDLRAMLSEIDAGLLNIAGRALQLTDWHVGHQFCGQCGVATVDSPNDRAMVCAACNLRYYPKLSPSIIVLVTRGDEVLLGRNHLFPEGLYSTLAGFVEPGETIEETVRREVKEEVGVNIGNLSYRGSQPWPFPNSLMLGFHAEYDSGDIVLQEDEIADAQWFPCSELPLIPGKFAISRWLIDEYLSMRGLPV